MPVPRVLFVCLGNICRSPLAEAALRSAAQDIGVALEVESAGTADYHVGKSPDPRSIATAAQHGIDLGDYQARQIEPSDFRTFTHIYALDHNNLADIEAIAPGDATAKVGLLLDVVPGRQGDDVVDPYHSNDEAFSQTWRDVDQAARIIAHRLEDFT